MWLIMRFVWAKHFQRARSTLEEMYENAVPQSSLYSLQMCTIYHTVTLDRALNVLNFKPSTLRLRGEFL